MAICSCLERSSASRSRSARIRGARSRLHSLGTGPRKACLSELIPTPQEARVSSPPPTEPVSPREVPTEVQRAQSGEQATEHTTLTRTAHESLQREVVCRHHQPSARSPQKRRWAWFKTRESGGQQHGSPCSENPGRPGQPAPTGPLVDQMTVE